MKISKNSQKKQKKIPFLWKNLNYLKQDLLIFWKPITGVVAIYGMVYAFVVIGFNFIIPIFTSSTNTGVLVSEQNQDSITKLFTNISNSIVFVTGDETSTVVQFVLFVLAFLALVSILRRTRKLGQAKISDAYFEGTGQFVSAALVFIIFLLFLIPISIGSTVLLAGISFASTAVESIGVGVFFIVSSLLSIWLYVKYWPAVFIASLPSVRPIFALKQASKLTKRNRLNIFFQFSGFMILSIMIIILLFTPIGILLPAIAPYWLFVLALGYFATSTLFGFIVYRGLVDD